MDVSWEMSVSFLPEALLLLFQPSPVGTQSDIRTSLQLHLLQSLSTPRCRMRFDLGVCRCFRKGFVDPRSASTALLWKLWCREEGLQPLPRFPLEKL